MSLTHPKYTAAVVQATPVYLDLDATVDKTVELIAEAAAHGARFVVFPETWVPGYPYWAWLGSPAYTAQWIQRYNDNSLALDTDAERKIADAAGEHSIFVSLGCSLREGASLYMGQILYDAEGRRVAARRKLKPTYLERAVFGEGQGDSLAVHETELGRLGALCCWEHFQPLTKYAMYSMNEQVHAAAWPSFSLLPEVYALGPELNDSASQMYAGEGGCFVLAATMPISEEIIDLLCDTPDQRELIGVGGGGSMIFGPDGSRLCEYLPPDQEGILYAELDLGLISLAKAAADPAGHYARPDVTRLVLNRRACTPVTHMSTQTTEAEGRDAPELPADGDAPHAENDAAPVGVG